MKAILLVAGLTASCGRSECSDYITVYCGKVVACIAPTATAADEKTCEDSARRQIEAEHRNDEQLCKNAREGIQDMTCTDFRALVAKYAR